MNSWGFKFYWNAPTFMCHQYGINFVEVTRDYGIIQNNNDSFRGNKIAILYDPGMFPALINNSSGTLQRRNGGVPQEGDLSKHLNLFQQHLNDQIDGDFSGLGIIDFESWRPIFRQHWVSLEAYKRLSIDIERSRHPWTSEKTLENLATKRFEKSGQIFMDETLKLAKKLRPNAKWSYYAYPYCFNVSPNDPSKAQCSLQVQSENNRMGWLWTIEDILMPSVYLNSKLSGTEKLNLITGRIDESLRIIRRYNLKSEIVLYFWPKYQDNRRKYLIKEDVINGFKAMINHNADGTIIWGSSQDVNSRQKCEEFINYLHNILGPAVLTAKSYAQHRYHKNVNKITTNDNNTTSSWSQDEIS
ncbi:hypothetical protein PV326_009152 [Microctonus aethiopoides]|nr:hypothetical protein PV326_009152 [Microctonus aethiopoides]